METPSNPKTEDYTYKQGQYSPRKRKDTTPKVNPQLAVELVFQELKRVEAYTKRIEDATTKKVEIILPCCFFNIFALYISEKMDI